MPYVKAILSGLGALILAEVLLGLRYLWVTNSKATGMAAVTGGLLESLFSPLFWLLAIAFFTLFFKASRSSNGALRTAFFWIPTVGVTCLGLAIVGLFSYLYFHFRNG